MSTAPVRWGKTYILRKFGEEQFQNVVYINLETNLTIASYFNENIQPERLLRYLEASTGERIIPGETLIISMRSNPVSAR